MGVDDDDESIDDTFRFRVYGDGALLASYDVRFGALVPIRVDVRKVLRLRLEITKIEGERFEDAYPTWATPIVFAARDVTTPTLPAVRPLPRPRLGSELGIVTFDYCDSSWRVGVVRINGTIHSDSLWCENDTVGDSGWVDFKLSRAYRTLNTTVGIHDGSVSSTDIYRVRIFGDGQLLQDFDIGFGTARPVSLDVRNVLRLRLSVEKISGPRFTDSYISFGEPTLSS